MASERQRQLMQEALDLALSAEQIAQLHAEIAEDLPAQRELQRLQRVDHLLRTAPSERAPQRLALGIMAKLAEALEAEAAVKVNTQEDFARKLGLAMVILITLPLLTSALALFMLAAGNPQLMESLLAKIIQLLRMMLQMLELFMQGARQIVQDHPEVPALMTALIPVLLYWMLRSPLRQHTEQPPEQKEDAHADQSG